MSEPTTPVACLLLIGNELLSGRTQDQNLAFAGQRLAALGIPLAEARVIADDTATIVRHVNDCRQQFDYVFTTGGIGPTHDDITAAAVARAFDRELERNPAAEQVLLEFYGDKVNAARLKMAEMPVGAVPIDNPLSGAPGFQIENVFVLAGIPSVMQAMFDALAERLDRGAPILSLTLTTNCREGELAAGLGEIQQQFPAVSIGSYPFFETDRYGVNLVLRGTRQDDLETVAAATEALIASLAGDCQR
ncbi:molybdenum cofactor synthesis domain-containing protein [Methylohalomonas lacus]|uniref:Molybdenum cofactor synthesis domain-containing protein n=1 Tax=Methylohalomonas lacus TaxID=398773 RepID=A0AAE3L0K9_9GAMM|nr:molybdopterin-binding protein [Methylohalomonas lacus]MCS3902185.1 molybdenum cofactor synthesis domain-containing protein [Methylohalomonas lacus]